MKFVVLQGDGMADEPIAELGGKTPLDAAQTPNLDRMARAGILGLTRTIPPGLPPGSDVGTMSVLGYDPTRYHTGRSPIEAASMGVELGSEDVAFRCNLVTLETPEGGVEVMRDFAAGHIPTAEAREIVEDLNRTLGGDGLEFHPGVSYRHLLVWRGGEHRMRTTPPHDLSDKPVGGAFPQGSGAAVLSGLMERSRAFLAEHRVCRARLARGERAPTAIWLWGQGKRPNLPRLRDRYGIDGSVIAAVDLVNGLGVLAGLVRIAVPGATGFLDTNFRGKAEYGLRALETRDFLFLHVEAPDEGGHMGDPRKKVEAIENFDEKVVGTILEGLRAMGGEWRVLVMPDHPTPCALKTHTSDPVPFVVYVSRDEQKARGVARGYNEKDAREHGIFIPEAHTIMDRLLRR
ncbi:MAG: cofactor-independent phosphoglycerate mutase [Deltaproteobacteria bacterium]|nr:MAG: cofactor-independent phosphoglycerate mutase [Deltaproteobacteria bacterium]TMA89139.1 MAG: cofactor-independent phosphoglycerate mutase [Deltaproteobacteria bacterium]TMB23168.1 MAG: cofactor-independent phosphoglycerate mutase [Deltaproteobacteria bacterium]